MAILVVSDASPLRALNHLELLTLCRDLYGSVIVPTAVHRELRHATAHCPAREITDFAWFDLMLADDAPVEYSGGDSRGGWMAGGGTSS